jgi:hypothetical protein
MSPIYLPPGTVAMSQDLFIYQQCAMMGCHGTTVLPFTRSTMTPAEEKLLNELSLGATITIVTLGTGSVASAANTLALGETAALVARMNSLRICSGTDCSEIAEALRAFAGRGKILRVSGRNGDDLRLLEYGRIESGFKYHEVFTDGRYIYDPRLSPAEVALRDWFRMIEDLNPGAVIK